MPSFKTLLSALALLAPLAAAQIEGHCDPIVSQQPNPIAKQYLKQTTGTLNGTIAIVPVTLAQAKALIPSKYAILTKQIAAWLPGFGANNYPLMVQMEQFHDLYHQGKSAGASADYLKAQVMFPFVDRLGDGYTAMAYSSQVIFSAAATSAQSGAAAIGYNVSQGYFASCNAYEYENATSNLALPPHSRGIDQAAWIDANTNLGNPNIATRYLPVASFPYTIDFFYNVTNQPTFASASSSLCNGLTRLYNTDVSESPYAPVRVKGNATALKGFFSPVGKTIWTDVYGLKIDVAFHNPGNVACSSLKGFSVINA